MPRRTWINGDLIDWPADVLAKWIATGRETAHAPDVVTDVNYFTPRPYVDEYNRGSQEEGFTYTVRTPNNATAISRVYQVLIIEHRKDA